MSGKQISLIYFYLVSIIALVLLVIGIYNVATFLINTTQYADYPLRYQNVDCETNPYQFKGPIPMGATPTMFPTTTPSADELKSYQQSCEKQLALQRKQQQLDDFKSAAVFTGVGLILFLIHFSQARKHSKS